MNDKKKTLKGTTLVEVIIALAVFALLGIILLQVGTAIDKSNRATNRLNKRVTIQAPYAASQSVDYVAYDSSGNIVLDEDGNLTRTLDFTPMNVSVSIDDNNGVPKNVEVEVRASADSETTEKRHITAQIGLTAQCYSTKPIVENNSNVYTDSSANSNHHLKFAIVESKIYLPDMTFDMDDPNTSNNQTLTSPYSALPAFDSSKCLSTNSGIATFSVASGVVTITAVGDDVDPTSHTGECDIICEYNGMQYITHVVVVKS